MLNETTNLLKRHNLTKEKRRDCWGENSDSFLQPITQIQENKMHDVLYEKPYRERNLNYDPFKNKKNKNAQFMTTYPKE